MAISEPRTMPTEGASEQNWRPARKDYGWREAGGRSGSVGSGPSPWRMELGLGEMSLAAGAAWRAFIDWCEGGARTFYVYDLLRPYPTNYPAGFTGLNRAGGGAFPADGAPTSWSIDATRRILTLNGLPAGFVLNIDDCIGFVWSTTRRHMVRVNEQVATSGGGVWTGTISPALPPSTVVPDAAAVKLYRAEVVMRLSPDETSLGSETSISRGGGRIICEQDLRP